MKVVAKYNIFQILSTNDKVSFIMFILKITMNHNNHVQTKAKKHLYDKNVCIPYHAISWPFDCNKLEGLDVAAFNRWGFSLLYHLTNTSKTMLDQNGETLDAFPMQNQESHDSSCQRKAVILNFSFEGFEHERKGSEHDVKRLQEALKEVRKLFLVLT